MNIFDDEGQAARGDGRFYHIRSSTRNPRLIVTVCLSVVATLSLLVLLGLVTHQSHEQSRFDEELTQMKTELDSWTLTLEREVNTSIALQGNLTTANEAIKRLTKFTPYQLHPVPSSKKVTNVVKNVPLKFKKEDILENSGHFLHLDKNDELVFYAPQNW